MTMASMSAKRRHAATSRPGKSTLRGKPPRDAEPVVTTAVDAAAPVGDVIPALARLLLALARKERGEGSP